MATFTFTPSFPASVSQQPRIVTSQFGDGYEQRVAFGINTKPKTWQLQFLNRDDTERDNILAFLEARGGVEAFDWTDPNGYAAKWVCSEWTVEQVSCNFNNVNTSFKEVFEA